MLVCLMVIGAWIRHYFNLRHAGRTLWWIPVTAALALAGVAVWIRPASTPGAVASRRAVTFARSQAIVAAALRVLPLAAADEPGHAAPKGIELDTPQEIAAQAAADPAGRRSCRR